MQLLKAALPKLLSKHMPQAATMLCWRCINADVPVVQVRVLHLSACKSGFTLAIFLSTIAGDGVHAH
jgi:hypothetical protein